MLSSFIDLLLLWFFLGVAVFMVYASIRARRLEEEEGLMPSRDRVVAASLVCVAIAVFVAFGTASILWPPTAFVPETPTKSPEKTAVPETNEELAKLNRERAELKKQMVDLEAKIQSLTKEPSPTEKPVEGPETNAGKSWYSYIDVRETARFCVPVAALVGAFLLFYLGDPRSLLAGIAQARRDRSELQKKAGESLDGLTAAADQGRFKDGLACADSVDAPLLDRFDRMDWAYLKSYCAVQLGSMSETPSDQAIPLLETAERTLTTLLEEAPKRAEAVYLLALARGLLGQFDKALDGFRNAQKALPASLELPSAENQSVCLLELAERRLSEGDVDGSGKLFDAVTELKVLVDKIPTSLVRVRLLNVRRAMQKGELTQAAQGIEVLRGLENLSGTLKSNVDAICDAMQALISVRSGDDAQVERKVSDFLTAHMPANLPVPDEGIADEYLDSPLTGTELRLSPEVYRSFLFLKAEVIARQAAREGPLSTVKVTAVATPLFQALQFQLRQRDVLAALGGLYFWFVPEKKRKALDWLEAAIDLGVESRIARRIIERSKQMEMENKEALDWFRATAGRFLHDPTVRRNVRLALVEELGRFQGFEPLLLELDPVLSQEPQEPTLALLRDRASYLEKMIADFATRRSDAVTPLLRAMCDDYTKLIGSIDASTDRIADIERRLMQEIGKTVMS